MIKDRKKKFYYAIVIKKKTIFQNSEIIQKIHFC